MSAVAPYIQVADPDAERIKALGQLLPQAEKDYQADLDAAIAAATAHCEARERLAESRRRVEGLRRQARGYGLRIRTPNLPFTVLQAQDEHYDLRVLKNRVMESLRGSW